MWVVRCCQRKIEVGVQERKPALEGQEVRVACVLDCFINTTICISWQKESLSGVLGNLWARDIVPSTTVVLCSKLLLPNLSFVQLEPGRKMDVSI